MHFSRNSLNFKIQKLTKDDGGKEGKKISEKKINGKKINERDVVVAFVWLISIV